MRKLWVLGWTVCVLFILTCMTCTGTAIVLQNNADGGIDEPLGGFGVFLIIPSIISALLMATWTSEAMPEKQTRQPRLPRDMRRELKRARQRAELDRRIKLAEEENEIAR